MAGVYLITLSIFDSYTANATARLTGGTVLSALGLVGLVISGRKVKKLQNILMNANVSTALKEEATPMFMNIGATQLHEVTYKYQVNERLYQVFLGTFWHNSCKPEESIAYSNTDHSESVLLRSLSDNLAKKIAGER